MAEHVVVKRADVERACLWECGTGVEGACLDLSHDNFVDGCVSCWARKCSIVTFVVERRLIIVLLIRCSGCVELIDDFYGEMFGVGARLRFKIFKQNLVQPTNPTRKRISQAEMPRWADRWALEACGVSVISLNPKSPPDSSPQ